MVYNTPCLLQHNSKGTQTMATSLLHMNSETSLCLQLLIVVPFNLSGLLLYAEIFSHQVIAAKPQH